MASITSSQIVSQVVQRDGRISINFSFTDNLGAVWTSAKLVAGGTDLNALLAADATALLAQLQEFEIQNNVDQVMTLGSLATISFKYSTQAQGLTALRLAYQTATQLQAIMTGDFLSSLTDVQLQNIFSMTAGQVTTLRANKLTPAAATAAAVRVALGQ